MNTTNHTSPSGEDASNGATKLLDAIISDLEGGFVRCQHCGEQEDTATLDVVPMLRDLRNLLTANGAIGEREAFETWAKGRYSTRHIGTYMDRTADAYEYTKLATAALDGWKARAALTAEKVAAEPIRTHPCKCGVCAECNWAMSHE